MIEKYNVLTVPPAFHFWLWQDCPYILFLIIYKSYRFKAIGFLHFICKQSTPHTNVRSIDNINNNKTITTFEDYSTKPICIIIYKGKK